MGSISPYILIAWAIINLLFFIAGVWIYRAYQRSKSRAVGDFAKFLLSSGIGFSIMVVGYYYLVKGIPSMKILVVAGGAIKTIALFYLFRLIFYFLEMKEIYKKIILGIIAGIITLFFVFKFYTVISLLLGIVDKPSPIMASLSLITVIILTGNAAISGGWFLVKSLTSSEGRVKLRGIIIGSGLLLISTNYAFCGAGGLVPLFWANPFMIAATFILIFGVFIPLRKKKPEELLAPKVPAAVSTPTSRIRW